MVNTTTVILHPLAITHPPAAYETPVTPLHPSLSSIPADQMVSALLGGHQRARREREKPHEQDSPDETFHPTDLCSPPPPHSLHTHSSRPLFLLRLVCFYRLTDSYSGDEVHVDKFVDKRKNRISWESWLHITQWWTVVCFAYARVL